MYRMITTRQLKQIVFTKIKKATIDFNQDKERIERLAKARLSICESCPIYINGRCDRDSTIEHMVTGEIVKGCGCNMKTKVYCEECSCPAEKWLHVDIETN